MSGKKTLLWALALLVLGAFYYYYEIKGEPKRQEAQKQRELLLSVRADDVTGLTIHRGEETVAAILQDGHWQLTSPLQVAGDDKKYQELVRYLAELRQTRLIEENPASVEPFGLAAPSLEVTVQLKEPEKPQTLRLGAKNPTSSSYYAQVAGQNAVYLVASVTKDTLDASLYDLRDKMVVAFKPEDVQEIQLAAADTPAIVLRRQEKEAWEMTAPVKDAADISQVRDMLKRLQEVRVKEFIEEAPANLATYGLDTPALRLDVQRGGEQPETTLLLGKLNTEKQGVYAKRSATERVILLPQDFWEKLPKTATALRDKALLKFDRDRVVRLEMQTPETHVLVSSTAPQQYTLEQPEQAPGDSDAVYRLLWDILELKATDIVTDTPEALGTYGLEAPRVHLSVVENPPADSQQEARTLQLLIGSEATDGKGVYVQRGGTPTVYLVELKGVEPLLNATAFALRDKKLLHFSSDSIAKIQVQYLNGQFALERHDKTWRLTEPTKQEVSQRWKVDSLLSDLQALEYVKIVSNVDTTPYGLDEPQATLTLWQQDGTVLGPVVIGKTTDTEIGEVQTAYARVESHEEKALYAIKADFLQHIPKESTEFTAQN